MSEVLRVIFWMIVALLGFLGVLTILIIIALIVKGVRSENVDFDYVSDTGYGRNVLDPESKSDGHKRGDSNSPNE